MPKERKKYERVAIDAATLSPALSQGRGESPAAEALPDLHGAALAQHLVFGVLGRSGAGVIGEDAHERADGEAREVDRAAAAPRDDAVLLVGVGDDQVLDRLARGIADDAIALVDFLLRGAAVARK